MKCSLDTIDCTIGVYLVYAYWNLPAAIKNAKTSALLSLRYTWE